MPTRILQPSSNPYAGGAVVFDSSPYANLYIQQVQREAAKDEALDQYFKEWDKSINPAGMRNQDTKDLFDIVNQSREFYFQNKKAIKNPSLDNGRAYSEYMSRQKEAMGLINGSKQAAQKEEFINRNILSAKQKGLPITDRVIQDLDAFRQSIKSQNWRDFNPDNLDFQPKPFDFARFTKDIYGDTKLSEKVVGERKVPESFEKITTFETFVDENELPKIESRASAAYRSSPSVKEFIDTLYQDPREITRLNDLYRNKYGKNISTPEDVAVSFALSLSPTGKTREVRTKDIAAELIEREKNIRTRPLRARSGGTGSGGSFGGGNLLDSFGVGQSIVTKGGNKIENGMILDKKGSPFTGKIFIERSQTPAQIYQVLKSAGSSSDFLDINKGFTVIANNGKIEALEGGRLGLITRQMIENAQRKFDTERKGEGMTFETQSVTTPKTTTKFKNIPNGGF